MLFGHVMSSHHSEQMSQRSQVLLLGGVLKMSLSLSLSLSLYLSLYFFMSSDMITLNKCIKDHKSLGWLLGGVLKMYLSLSLSLSSYLSLSLSFCWSGHVPSSL